MFQGSLAPRGVEDLRGRARAREERAGHGPLVLDGRGLAGEEEAPVDGRGEVVDVRVARARGPERVRAPGVRVVRPVRRVRGDGRRDLALRVTATQIRVR